jgi:ribosomal protein L35AE/L33A
MFVGWADAESGVLIEGELLRQRGAESVAGRNRLATPLPGRKIVKKHIDSP